MIRKICLFTALCLVSLTSNAQSDWDDTLRKYNLVDDSYVYKDEVAVAIIFREATNSFSSSLPMKVNSTIEGTMAMFTPYLMVYGYRFMPNIGSEQWHELKYHLTSNDSLLKLCNLEHINYEFKVANSVETS